MTTLDTTVAVYADPSEAERDWQAMEDRIRANEFSVTDSALIETRGGQTVVLKQTSRHGWGKGAVAGAVIGILFPPSLVGAAAVGAGGGELIARMTRALGRSHIKDLGETLDSAEVAIVVISPAESTNALCHTLKSALRTTTVPSASMAEIRQALE
jgi:uncharacterized membrane protein